MTAGAHEAIATAHGAESVDELAKRLDKARRALEAISVRSEQLLFDLVDLDD